MDMLPVDHLIAATLRDDDEEAERLLSNDPELVHSRNMFGASIVHAAHFGRSSAVSQLLDEHSVALDPMIAVEIGRLDLVRQAIADDNTFATHFTDSGSTALHGAAYWGQVEVAEVLLDAGADPNAVSRDAFLQIAPLGAAVATTPGIPQPSDDEDVVLELVRLLLERGAAVNARRKDGMTALHGVAFRGLARVAQELLDAGADPILAATDGRHRDETPADTALAQGHLLLAADLDVPGASIARPYG
jgi:uncharacterized protein